MFRKTSAVVVVATIAALTGLAGFMLGKSDARAAAVIYPTTISKAQIAGRIFEDHEPVVAGAGESATYDVEVFLSSDRLFDAGMYRAGKGRFEITEPYGVNEYMHFIEGGVTLTSSDGTVTSINAGDSVIIPKEWTGIWESAGYLKIYVIYSPDAPIE